MELDFASSLEGDFNRQLAGTLPSPNPECCISHCVRVFGILGHLVKTNSLATAIGKVIMLLLLQLICLLQIDR